MSTINEILKAARRYSKNVSNNSLPSIKIAVLGSASIQHFVMLLKYKLSLEGIVADIYEGEYNGINMDVFDEASYLYKFNPNIVIIIPHYRDIKAFPRAFDEEEDINSMCEEAYYYFEEIWKHINSKNENVQIVQSTIMIPPERTLGNLEFIEGYSRYNYYERINSKIRSNNYSNVSVVDLDRISSIYGKKLWFDYSAYFLSKSFCCLECLEYMVDPFVSYICSTAGKIKKCIVLDLDNTLWGGVVGDVGAYGIQIDPNNALGEAFRYFQSYLLQLKNRGVILAVCSKNDEDVAKEPFINNTNMLLKLDDISCFIANWDDKASNLKVIAERLNIGVDSLVFFDDNPAERQIVKQFLPEVQVVDVPNDPALYVTAIEDCNPFDWVEITREDVLRNNTYLENKKRENLQIQFVNYEEYLQALEMSGKVGVVTLKEIARFTQLLNKSNQFNLRTIRYNEAEIKKIIADSNYLCLYVHLKDKFSDYGIISCIILHFKEETCFIDSWVMSCRVLKRKIEYLVFKHIYKYASEAGCARIVGEYIPTKKNRMVADFYTIMGFDKTKEEDGIVSYEFLLSNGYEYNEIPISEEGE